MRTLDNKEFLLEKFFMKCFKLLSERGLLLIIMLMLMQVTETYTLSSNSVSVMPTYHHVMTATTTMTLVSGKMDDEKKPLTKKELLMSSLSKSMDYLDEDSDEIYDDAHNLNYTGEISTLIPKILTYWINLYF